MSIVEGIKQFLPGASSSKNGAAVKSHESAFNLAKRRIENQQKLHREVDQQLKHGDLGPEELKEYTGSELLPVFQDSQPIWKDWDTKDAIQEGYKSSVWVYACAYRLAKSAASANWKVYRKTGDDKERAADSEYQDLLDAPNDNQTSQTLMELITLHLNLGGNALASIVGVNNRPDELWMIDPAHTEPVPTNDRGEWLEHYKYNKGGNKKEFDPESVIHWQFSDPENQYWGQSPLKAAAKAVDIENEAEDFQKVSLQNRMMADGLITFDKPLTEDQHARAKDEVKNRDAREPMVIGNEARFEALNMTPAEMDFIKSRKMTRTQICAAYGVPQPLVGIYENATLSNIQTARSIFWLDTMIPFLDDIQATINLSLSPLFGDEYYVEYDVNHLSVLLDVLIKKAELVKTFFDRGVPMGVLDRWLDLGLPEYDGKQTPFIKGGYAPSNMLTGSANSPPFGGE
jgi:HK97 family phage portal protein